MGFVPEMLLMLIPAAFGALYVASSRGLIERALAMRELRRTPRGAVRELVEGRAVRLVGRVEVDEGTRLLEAPLSGRPCVAFRAVVSQSEDRSIGQVIIDDHDAVPFWVRDATGRALVPRRALPWLRLTRVARSGVFQPTSERHERYLRRFGVSSRGLVLGKPTEFEEGVVAPGDVVVVAGHGRFDPTLGAEGESGYRERAGAAVLDPLRDGHVLVSDQPEAMR